MKISLCVICGNESAYATRFLDSFAKDFDELCLVRAVGNQEHDDTVSQCMKWCERNGKQFKFAEYRNDGGIRMFGTEVRDDDPATWPHVDDFAAARNVSWLLATCDWQFWADFDDILAPESRGLIRECAESGKAEYYFFTYGIKTSNEMNMRERLFQVGHAHWSQPVHENCKIHDVNAPYFHDARVIFSHEPDHRKQRDPDRNLRIAKHSLRYLNAFAPEIQREYFWKWQGENEPAKKAELLEQATQWAEIAVKCNLITEQRVALLLNMSCAAIERDPEHAMDLVWSAVRVAPVSREPWGVMAEHELWRGNAGMADIAAALMQTMKRPPTSGMPLSRRFYEDYGFYLRMRTLRASGQHEKAAHEELGMFKKYGAKISLLHATRGRPKQALAARADFLRAAVTPFAIEHIFAVDADDAETLEATAGYRRVVVENPNGCVKAWNAAAEFSNGHILVQMSDDWLPCVHWDQLIWLALSDAALAKLEQPPIAPGYVGDPEIARSNAIQSVPLVLAIHDGHRTDALLCMAILTRARYENVGLFSEDYFGVFSDNELTHRAYDDGVVIQAQHICFQHNHPVFAGKPIAEWDETHRRQNAAERYAEGKKIFNFRNPKHAIP